MKKIIKKIISYIKYKEYEKVNMTKKTKNYKYRKENKNFKRIKNISINILVLIIIIIESFFIAKLYSSIKRINNKFSKTNNFAMGVNMSYNINNEIEKNDSSKKYKIVPEKEALEISKKYMEICKNGLLIHNKTFIKSKQPKISVIIPVYNSEKTIKSAIRSIQNQNMLDIEIILVNDCPTDNTTKIIEEIQKEDPRILIIYNNKNMGTFYSRNIGVLQSNGEFITTIDNDDIFADKDVFDCIYEETQEKYFDIISFRAFITSKNDYIRYFLANINKLKNYIVHQPQLGIFPVYPNHPIYNNHILIWGKLIKNEIYKAAVGLLGKERYSTYLIWNEDTSIFFIICSIAQSFKFIEKYGIFHFYKKSNSTIITTDHCMFGEIFLLNAIFDFSSNEHKKYAAYKLIEIKNKAHFSLSNENNKKYFKYVVKKIMNCDYIEEKDKNDIRKRYKGVDIFS